MRVACPYCYRQIDASRLWFRCRGRAAAGRAPCPLAVDEIRQRETRFKEPSRPSFPPRGGIRASNVATCPGCGGETTVRVCPKCHSPLPIDFGETYSPLIALVGTRGTGKTVYLTVLAQELHTRLRERFDADVHFVGDMDRDSAAPEWWSNHYTSVYEHNVLFQRTERAIDGRSEPVVLKWRQNRHLGWVPRLRTSFLSFYDTAGDDLGSQSSTNELTYLTAADALILLLDPFNLPNTRDRIYLPESAITSREPTDQVVDRVTTALLQPTRRSRLTGKIRIPVAIAFAKMDAFFDLLGATHPLVTVPEPATYHDDQAGRQTHEHVKSLLFDLGARDIDRHLRLHYEAFRYFGVSALGAQPNYETGTIHSGGIRPHRVDEPLVWLLSRFGVVPSRERR